jgi:hypothetical protein
MDEKSYLAPNVQSFKFDKLTEGIWASWLKNITVVLQEGRHSKWMEQFTGAPTYGEDGGTWRELLTTLRAGVPQRDANGARCNWTYQEECRGSSS